MHKALRAALPVCLMLAGTVHAAVSPLRGVWSGTIGSQSVMACFDPGSGSSSYYYPRYPMGLVLIDPSMPGGDWQEKSQGKVSGGWSLQPPVNDQLLGTWHAANGKRSAPIKLTRIGAAGDAAPCDSKLFNQPRQAGARLHVDEVRTLGNKRYQKVSTLKGELATVQLLDDGAHVAAINRALREALQSEVSAYYGCYAAVSAEEGGFAQYSTRTEPVVWSARWLTLRTSNENSCGGAHPNSDQGYETWSLVTGGKTDVWRWFKNKGDSAALRSLIVQLAKPSDECREVMSDNTSYSVYPGQGAMVFYPQLPHVAQACADEIRAPYRQLLPFLTPAGKAEVEALQMPGH